MRKKRRRPRKFAILSLYSILGKARTCIVISNMMRKENEFGKEKDKL